MSEGRNSDVASQKNYPLIYTKVHSLCINQRAIITSLFSTTNQIKILTIHEPSQYST